MLATSTGHCIILRIQNRADCSGEIIKVLVLILATFGICWRPLQVIVLYSEYRTERAVQVSLLKSWCSYWQHSEYVGYPLQVIVLYSEYRTERAVQVSVSAIGKMVLISVLTKGPDE